MPSVKDFEKKNKKKKHSAKSEAIDSDLDQTSSTDEAAEIKVEKRRPATEAAGHSHDHDSEEAVYVKTEPTEEKTSVIAEDDTSSADFSSSDSSTASDSSSDFSSSEDNGFGSDSSDDKKHVHIEFVGSEMLRSKVPKVFEVAEAVADDWVNDGNFEALPVGHPLAQLAASVGLKKAKQVENKLREKGVFMMIQIGVEYAKSKLNKK